MIPLVDLRLQYSRMKPEMDKVISVVIEDGKFIGGDKVNSFSQEFARYCSAGYCVPCGNGTDALEIALKVLQIGKGDEVIIPAFTFIATLEAVCQSGATPVLCDIDPATYLIDINNCQELISSKTKAIIPVHLYGLMADVASLQELCRKNSLYLIEDAAQAHGASRNNIRSGSTGDFSTFSFYPGKNLGAFGDAGAILTNYANYAQHATKIANHGRLAKYDHDIIGRNSRMDTLQAAILSLKLKYLDDWNQSRQNLARRYFSNLSNVEGLVLPKVPEEAIHVFHLFVVRIKGSKRSELRKFLAAKGIETGIHYPIALSKLKATIEELGINASCPVAENAASEVLSLPMFPELAFEQVDEVCLAIKEFYS